MTQKSIKFFLNEFLANRQKIIIPQTKLMLTILMTFEV